MLNKIESLLRFLGGHGQYRGFRQAAIALLLILEDPERMYAIGESIYAEVAKRCHCNPKCIERNIRTVIHRAWRTNKKRLCALAGYELTAEPSVSEFLDLLAAELRRRENEERPPALTGTWRDY